MLLWQLPIAIAALIALATAIFIATRPSKREFSESLTTPLHQRAERR